MNIPHPFEQTSDPCLLQNHLQSLRSKTIPPRLFATVWELCDLRWHTVLKDRVQGVLQGMQRDADTASYTPLERFCIQCHIAVFTQLVQHKYITKNQILAIIVRHTPPPNFQLQSYLLTLMETFAIATKSKFLDFDAPTAKNSSSNPASLA